jgi:hypothetical protein
MRRVVGVLSMLLVSAPGCRRAGESAASGELELRHLYASPQAWQQEYERVVAAAKRWTLPGTLGRSAGDLFRGARRRQPRHARLSARLRARQPASRRGSAVATNQEREQQVQTLGTTISERPRDGAEIPH